MGEIVKSVVVNEAVSRLSSLVSSIRGEPEGDKAIRAERLEMALFKIQAAVALSEDWLITSNSPLLRWKAKLKRVADEGERILQVHEKQRQDEEDDAAATGNSTSSTISSSRRVVRTAKRFAPFGRGPTRLISSATVQRFERLAGDAGDYLRFVQSGNGHCRPKSLGVEHTMTGTLLAGKTIECSFARGSGTTRLLLLPMLMVEHQDKCHDGGVGLEACLFVYYEDDDNWERNTKIKVLFHVSEAVDVAGVAASCMELLPSQFSDAATVTKQALHQAMLSEAPDRFGPSAMAVWFARGIWGRGPICAASLGRKGSDTRGGGQPRLPEAVFFFYASCIIVLHLALQRRCPPC